MDGQLILSNGWLSRTASVMELHGEAGGADQQGVARAQRELPGIIERTSSISMRQGYFTNKQHESIKAHSPFVYDGTYDFSCT